jgi:hypothetical protein
MLSRNTRGFLIIHSWITINSQIQPQFFNLSLSFESPMGINPTNMICNTNIEDIYVFKIFDHISLNTSMTSVYWSNSPEIWNKTPSWFGHDRLDSLLI